MKYRSNEWKATILDPQVAMRWADQLEREHDADVASNFRRAFNERAVFGDEHSEYRFWATGVGVMTTRIEFLRALQARIRESKGADRELDADIAKAFNQYVPIPGRCDGMLEPLACSTSLDACVALMAAVLPGWQWERDRRGCFFLTRVPLDCPLPRNARLDGKNDPLATDCHTFLDAIVSAKISELEAQKTTEGANG